MRQGDNGSDQEGVFEDELCNQCIEKITRLAALIEIEENKLFKAMRNKKTNGIAPSMRFLKNSKEH